MPNLRVSAALCNRQLDLIRTALDAGGDAGTMKIYSGAQPATPDSSITTQRCLATLILSYPCSPPAAGSTLKFDRIYEDDGAEANGVATWARFADSSGGAVFDCDVGESGATVTINSKDIVVGGPVRCTGVSIMVGG